MTTMKTTSATTELGSKLAYLTRALKTSIGSPQR